MTVCNLFKELTKDTGNFLMFEQYAEDLTRYLAQHNVAQVQPSRFLALDIDYSAINKHNISETEPNRVIPNVIQNYYENACAYFKYSMEEGEYTPLISRNAFWNALNDAGLLHFDEFTTDATTIFNENDEPIVSPPTGLKWLRELKYRGDINLHSYTEEDCIGYNEVYCYIPGDAPDRRYGVKLNSKILSLPYDRDLIMGFKEEDRDFEGILDLFVGEDYEYPYSEVISFFDENENDLESYKTKVKKFTFNTLVVLYDIVTEDGVLFKDIPLGMYLTGKADGEGHIPAITKYVSNSDIYGAGTSYGLRISTKFNVTPNATYIKEILVNNEDYTSEFIRTLSSFSESQKKMNDILSSVEANNLSIKNHLSSFKNYRTNIPYPIRIGDKMYWFVNGKNTNATLQGVEGIQGVTGERGPAGNQGPRGVQGVTGPRGPQGVTGPQGATGSKGDRGVTGSKGDRGATGVTGLQGVTGPAGKSAYWHTSNKDHLTVEDIITNNWIPGDQVLDINGYIWEVRGTATEPTITITDVCIKGASGPAGPTGDRGVTGVAGLQGVTGPQGATGPKGDRGDKGDPGTSGSVPTGTIQMYAGSDAPDGWMLCDGYKEEAIVPGDENDYTFTTSGSGPGGTIKYYYWKVTNNDTKNLFKVIGIRYGYGITASNVTSVFIPNFKGRFPLGVGDSGNTGSVSHALGSKGGEEKHTLTADESGLPSHSHSLLVDTDSSSGHTQPNLPDGSPAGTDAHTLNQTTGPEPNYTKDTDNQYGTRTMYDNEPSDASVAHNNMPPYLTVNFIIKL